MRDITKVMETIGILLTDDDGNYRSVKDVFDDLSEVWTKLDESTKQSLVYTALEI